jgi:hypothetical protein
MRRGCAALRAIAGKRALEEPRLDQLFAEPIVKQLMDRDRIDEATIRRLLRQTAVARATPFGAAGRGAACPRDGSTVASRHPLCLGYCSTDYEAASGLIGHSTEVVGS